MPPLLEVDDLHMHFFTRDGVVKAVDGVSFAIQEGICFGLLGPNGAGKTTTIEMIEEIIPETSGEIRYRGKSRAPDFNRHIGIQFQQTTLLDFLTVKETLKIFQAFYGIRADIDRLVRLCQLEEILGQYNDRISGGQKQRVAIARALAVAPAVLLLDEPLSALDLKLRKHMRVALREIQRRTSVTFVYITHDQGEALTMSDRVGVMSVGRLEQVGAPDRIYNAPESAFVAAFVGETNMLDGTIAHARNGTAVIETPSGRISCRNPRGLSRGDESTLFVRPETIFLADRTDGGNLLDCTVTHHSFEGAYANIGLETRGGQQLIMRCTNDGSGPAVAVGGNVRVGFQPENALLFPADEFSDGGPADA